MLFPTFTFFIFLAPVLLLNWFLKRWPLPWRIYLLAVSYFFYATWSWRFLIVLATLTLATYIASKLMQRRRAKFWLTVGVFLNLAALVVFKYYDFFRVSFESAAANFGFTASWPVLQFLLPVGLSFYVLRAIAYLVDVRRERVEPANLLDFALYLAFFPQLLSGPIAKPAEFLPQLKDGGAKAIPDYHLQFARILLGLFKKLVIGSYFLHLADAVFAVPGTYPAFTVLLGLYAYALVIYADFSGYTDMAIGIAGLLGFISPENFRTPYLAVSIQDFWRRWHISFSDWLRHYVYVPLGGSRVSPLRRSANLMATMLVSGLWHGAGLNYILWGAIHGAGLLVHRLFGDLKARLGTTMTRAGRFFGWILTFHFVVFAWVFFRSATFGEALAVFRALAPHESTGGAPGWYFVGALALAFVFLFTEVRLVALYEAAQRRLPFIAQVALLAGLTILIIELGPDIVPPFIYFQF